MRAWLRTPLRVTQGGVLAAATMLGMFLGGLTFVAIDQYVEIGQQADENSDSIARLERLERPPTASERRAIDRRLDRLTRAQARKLLDLLLNASTPAQRQRLLPEAERGSAGATLRQGSGARSGRGLTAGSRTGRTTRAPAPAARGTAPAPSRGSTPSGSSTAPPTQGGSATTPAVPVTPVRPRPLIDVPPVDLDGPGGLAPPIVNLPPVDLPPLP